MTTKSLVNYQGTVAEAEETAMTRGRERVRIEESRTEISHLKLLSCKKTKTTRSSPAETMSSHAQSSTTNPECATNGISRECASMIAHTKTATYLTLNTLNSKRMDHGVPSNQPKLKVRVGV
jgi:hypothetical protein